jgi:hypothetical protein
MSQLPPGFELDSGVPMGFEAEPLDQTNWSFFADAQIKRRREERLSKTGQDLSQAEQAGIMDAYRLGVGLKPTNYDAFKANAEYTAAHQGELLNLARSTSAAFENQGFTLSGLGVLAPEWTKQKRADIEAMNPHRRGDWSETAGDVVASAPLLLGTGGTARMAGIFGAQAGLQSLEQSDIAGVTGAKKYAGALGSAAASAGSIVAGGKLAEFTTKALASKIPALAEFLAKTGPEATTRSVSQIIANEATQAGLSIPPVVATMMAGNIADNLIAQQTSDPSRKWDDGLAHTAVFAAALTLGTHGMKAGEAVRNRPIPPAEIPPGFAEEVGPVVPGTENYPQSRAIVKYTGGGPLATIPKPEPIIPTDRGRTYSPESPEVKEQIAPFPPQGSIPATSIIDLIERAPGGPGQPIPEPPNVQRVPQDTLTASVTPEGQVNIDQRVPRLYEPAEGIVVDVDAALKVHEETELKSLNDGKPYQEAHQDALRAEHDYVANQGADPAEYERFLAPYEAQLGRLTPKGNPPIDQRQAPALTTTPPEMPTTPRGLRGRIQTILTPPGETGILGERPIRPVPAPMPGPVQTTALPQGKGILGERPIPPVPAPMPEPVTPAPEGQIEYRQAGITGAQMLQAANKLTGGKAGEIITSFADDVKKTFAPATRGEGGAQAAAALRETGGGEARKMDQVRESFRAAFKFMDKGLSTQPGKDAMVDFMDRINRGQRQATPELQSIADGLDTMLKAGRDEVRQLGTGALEKFYRDYFPKQFAKPDAVAKWFGSRNKTLTGPKSFLKHRLDWDLADAIKAGFEPATYNPVEMAVTKYGELQKYIAGVRALKMLEANGKIVRIQTGQDVPEGWTKIHDKIGLYQETDASGQKIKGSFYAQREVADLINNHLSPGLRGKPWFGAILGAGNMVNQFQLGLSTFHIGFTGFDAITSKFAQGIQRLVNYSDVAGALKDLMGSPIAPLTTAIQGRKAVAEWVAPGTQGKELGQLVKILEAAGARTHIDEIYRTHITDNMMRAFRQGNIFGGVLRGLMLPIELPTRAVMKIAMYQKWGIATDLLRMEMVNNPNITHAELLEKARKIWDSADNRMGQLVYDNLFWNKVTKDLAMLTTRSVGWNLGTFREIVGGGADMFKAALLPGQKRELSARAAYLVALPAVTAVMGAVLQYMFTGKGPSELKDYFFPQTGGLDERGRPARITLPTYMKDIYHYGVAPLETLKNKVHPLLTITAEMLENKDFYGVKIRNEDDPFMQRRLQDMKYLGTTLTPLSIRNFQQERQTGASFGGAVKSFFGITPAPASVGRSNFENAVSTLQAERSPSGGKSPEQGEKTKAERKILLAASQKDFRPLQEALQSQKITLARARELMRESGETPLERQIGQVGLPDIMRKYDLATPEEKAALRVPLLKKLRNYAGESLPAETKAMIELFRQKGILK